MIEALALQSAVKRVAAVVHRRNTIPILGHLLLIAAGDSLTIEATDLDMSAAVTVPAKDIGTWSATVDASGLADMAKKLDREAAVAIYPPGEGDPHRVTLRSGRQDHRFAALDPGDFPRMADLEPVGVLRVVSAALVDEIKALAPYMAKESVSPSRACMFLHMGEHGARLVAMGDRLGKRDLVHTLAGEPTTVAIPAGAVAWMAKHLDRDGSTELELTPDRITIRAGDLVFSAKAHACAKMPDYAALGAGDAPAVLLEADHLRDAIELVMACSSVPRGQREVRVTLTDGEATVHCRDYYGAEGVTFIDAAADDGAGLELHAYGSQVVAALRTFRKGEAIEVRAAPRGNVEIRSAEDPTREAVVSPIRERPTSKPREVAEVTFTMPKRDERTDIEVTTYTVVVDDDEIRRPLEREYSFPSYHAAARAFRRHHAAFGRHSEVRARRAYYGDGDTLNPLAMGPCSILPMADIDARAQEYRRRQDVIDAARWVFESTADHHVPWPRSVVDLADSRRFGITPEVRQETKAMQVRADRILAAARPPAPAAPPPPPVAHINRVRIWASPDGRWGYAGQPARFTGLGNREAAVRHAIAEHPLSRVVLAADHAPPPCPAFLAVRGHLALVA